MVRGNSQRSLFGFRTRRLEALAGDETLFPAPVVGTSWSSSLPEIASVEFWSYDSAASAGRSLPDEEVPVILENRGKEFGNARKT